MQHQERIHNSHNQEWIEELLPDDESGTENVFEVKGKDVWNLIQSLMKKANVVRISIWHKDRMMASIPIVYGGVMAAFFPYLSLFSLISLLALQCKVVVERG